MKKICIYLITTCFAFATQAQTPDTLRQKNTQQWLKKTVPPLLLIGYGISTIKNNGLFLSSYEANDFLQKQLPNFNTKLDEVAWAAPAAAVYGLDWLGVPAKNTFRERTLRLAAAGVLTATLTYGTKHAVQLTRPDGSDKRSFPSSHVSQAFVAATFMHYEYGKKNITYSIAAYSVASSVAFMRMANRRHWLSDVAAGAGIGWLSTHLVYQLREKHQAKRQTASISRYSVSPCYTSQWKGVYFAYQF